MTWLLAAYGAVALAIGLYLARLSNLRRGLHAEIEALKRRS